MRYGKKIIKSLILLERGEKVYSKDLGKFAEVLYQRGHFKPSFRGQYTYYQVRDMEAFKQDLINIDESFRDLQKLLSLYEKGGNITRAEMASYNGNSKIRNKRTFNGFMINTYTPINTMLNHREYNVMPREGTFIFVYDWRNFSIPENVVIIGIENPENYEHIRSQKRLFERAVEKITGDNETPILFVSRYPQENSSSDLRSWLISIPNKYIHYGDFDLKGIDIFHTEFYKYLGNRSTYLIPDNIEQLIANGHRDRYYDQYNYRGIKSPLKDVQDLIDLINKYERCYDQEGLEF
ncbi:MAG: hypothetical protein E7103_05295 [Prevotella sp.]|nr:hypothetical protein [Prevotella sp.]